MSFGHWSFSQRTFGLLSAMLAGCFPAVFPTDVRTTYETIDSETIDPIIKDQSIPARIKNLRGTELRIYLRDDLCTCSKVKTLKLSVSEANQTGFRGYEVFTGTAAYGSWYWNQLTEDQKKVCSSFINATKAISEARSISQSGPFYFKESFDLIWEAEMALEPLECDPVRAKILADKAKEIAIDEGVNLPGYDISGNYVSEVSGFHPVITILRELKETTSPRISIKQDGERITGTDGSGSAILLGSRPEKFLQDTVRFKFFYPETNTGEIEGEWNVIDGGSSLRGKWRDPVSNTSGEWNLFRIEQLKEKLGEFKNMAKSQEKFFSRRSAIEVKWDQIDKFLIPGKDRDWATCIVFPGNVGICAD